MANTQLFASSRGRYVPPADACNEAGGTAYARGPKATLALYAATGCFNGVFYADAQTQLAQVLAMCEQAPAEFVAKTAIYARQRAFMKDVPALLVAHLAQRDGGLMTQAFDRVIDNGRMLRNFVQILRSGAVGRKSLGTRPKRAVKRWLDRASIQSILSASVGQSPSLADVVRMVHPKPVDAERAALFAWLIGKPYQVEALPAIVREFEAFKQSTDAAVPDLPFQFLTALPLSNEHWKLIAQRASWQTTRMNLNTFARHGVFADGALVELLAARLRDAESIRRARVFPYQLLAAFRSAAEGVPAAIVEALQDAMEIATCNVPKVKGNVVVAVDVSGSMNSAITGRRKGATSKVRCVEVAALIAACIKRVNPEARVLPFAEAVRAIRLNSRDSVMTQADQMTALCGGGTKVSAPLAQLNQEGAPVDLLVMVSDNQSWIDTRASGGTETMRQWAQIKARSPAARMVCIDLQPYATSQAVESHDVLHVGGFSDAVFDLLSAIAENGVSAASWVEQIEAIAL
jgi:60 kDa SS-A/Ro ribonucleoprotein